VAVDATGGLFQVLNGPQQPIADFHVENGEAHLDALSAGRATLTATFDGQSASATISIFRARPSASYRSVVTRTHSRLRDA